jgi:integrase
MARRRGKGEGTITQRADGRWQARVDLGRGPNGERRRKVAYGATRKDAAKALNGLLGRASTGELLTTSTPTVQAWLDQWYTTHRDKWRGSTPRIYRTAIDQWIVPSLGPIRLDALTPARVQRWINDATTDGARQKVIIARVELRQALQWAMHQRLLTFNAATLCKLPTPTRQTVRPLSVVEARRLLDVLDDHRLGAMALISMTMGLRIGEVSGLAWSDVDLAAGTLKVRQQVQALGKGSPPVLAPLKTTHSRRTLALPARVVTALQARRKAQLEERLRAGARWQATHDLIFTTKTGAMLYPDVVRDMLADRLTAADVPPVRFHAMRHTCATTLLAAGVPLFDVSRVLGHASIKITADTYGHLAPDMTAGAAARMDDVFGVGGGVR